MSVRSRRAEHRWSRATLGESLLLVGLLVAACATALAVVQAAHQSRDLNHELATLEQVAERARTEYDRLLLEQSAWSGHGRVTELAQEKLSMEAPDPFAIVIVE